MDADEFDNVTPLISLIDEIAKKGDATWGIACIRRHTLKAMTNEAFLLAVTPAIQEATEARVFFSENKNIYIAWSGEQKAIYKHIRGVVLATLVQAGMAAEPLAVISYMDPKARGAEFKATLESELEKSAQANMTKAKPKIPVPVDASPFDIDDEEETEKDSKGTKSIFAVTPEQVTSYIEIRDQRPFRKQLQILVVEDQIFSQRLLCEILRGARTTTREAPAVDAVQTIREAWDLFLKKAHDIAFIDLGLLDGSGHALTRAIKELDPMAQVIIVTANPYEGELGVARQNNVDGFIMKPYTKKQVLDYIDRYVSSHKGGTRGAINKF